MTPLTTRIRRGAARLFSAQTMERLIDPVLSDIEIESESAARERRVWQRRWVQARGCAALAKAIVIHVCTNGWSIRDSMSSEDRRALGRAPILTIVFTMAIVFGLAGRPLYDIHRQFPAHTAFLVYVVPQALPVAVPIGLMLGVLFGPRRRPSRRLTCAVLVVALACSVAMFMISGWFIPAANQTFRVTIAGQMPDAPIAERLVSTKGVAELTTPELRRLLTRAYTSSTARAYETRWTLTCTPAVIAIFALAVRRHEDGRVLCGVAACVAVLTYYALLTFGALVARGGVLPAVLLAWLPNGGIAALSLLVLMQPQQERLAHPAA